MSGIVFYKIALRPCYKCGKPAAYEIQATGNVTYSYACQRHADQRIRDLTKDHDRLNRSLAQDGTR